MMRWPHPPRALTLLLVAACVCSFLGSAHAETEFDQTIYLGSPERDTILSQETYRRAGRGDRAARQALQIQLFGDAYILGASQYIVESGSTNPDALPSLERSILWPVRRNGKAWPVLDQGKNTLGWHQWPRIEYDSRSEYFNSARAMVSEADRLVRMGDRSGYLYAADRRLGNPPSPDLLEARLPALLLQPVWAYYRMYGKLPGTPGDAYRELGLALIDDAELELLEHYTPTFHADADRLQLRLAPHDPSRELLVANAFLDPVLGTFVLESRRVRHGIMEPATGEMRRERRAPIGCGMRDSFTFRRGSPLPSWCTWRDADIPVISSPITDFLRDGPMIPGEGKPLSQPLMEALEDMLKIGPKFAEAQENRVL